MRRTAMRRCSLPLYTALMWANPANPANTLTSFAPLHTAQHRSAPPARLTSPLLTTTSSMISPLPVQ